MLRELTSPSMDATMILAETLAASRKELGKKPIKPTNQNILVNGLNNLVWMKLIE